MDLFRGELEGPLAGNCALQIDDGVHFRRVDLAQETLRPAHRDLGLQRTVGVHVEIVGRMMKLQRNGHRNLDSRIASHHPPHQYRDRQRDHLETEIFQDILAEEVEWGGEHGVIAPLHRPGRDCGLGAHARLHARRMTIRGR